MACRRVLSNGPLLLAGSRPVVGLYGPSSRYRRCGKGKCRVPVASSIRVYAISTDEGPVFNFGFEAFVATALKSTVY
jgi:hypothetical protein